MYTSIYWDSYLYIYCTIIYMYSYLISIHLFISSMDSTNPPKMPTGSHLRRADDHGGSSTVSPTGLSLGFPRTTGPACHRKKPPVTRGRFLGFNSWKSMKLLLDQNGGRKKPFLYSRIMPYIVFKLTNKETLQCPILQILDFRLHPPWFVWFLGELSICGRDYISPPNTGFEGKIYRKAIYLRVKTVKTLVSCKQSQQSLQPIHWSNCYTLDPHLQNGSMFSFRNPYLCWNIRFLFKNSQGPGAKPQNLACRNTLGRGVTIHFHVLLALQPPNRIGKHGFWSHNSY